LYTEYQLSIAAISDDPGMQSDHHAHGYLTSLRASPPFGKYQTITAW